MPRPRPRGIVGRQQWWPDEDNLKTIFECGRKGMNRKLTAFSVGISPETWSRKVAIYPQIEHAWFAGRAKGAEEVGAKLYVNATEPARDKEGNAVGPPAGSVAAQVAYMKEVGEWKERAEITGPEGGAIPITIVLPKKKDG